MKLDKNIPFLVLAIAICSLDQISKTMIVNYLGLYQEIKVTSLFSFLLIYNESTVFSNYQLENWPFKITLMYFKVIYASFVSVLLISILFINKSIFMTELGKISQFIRAGLIFFICRWIRQLARSSF